MVHLEKKFIQLFRNDDDMMFVYVALRELMERDPLFDSSDPTLHVSPYMLCYRLYKDYDDIYLRLLSNGINKMIDSGILSVVKSYKKGIYIINLENLIVDPKKDLFVSIYLKDIRNVLQHDSNIRKTTRVSILHYLVNLVSTFHVSKELGAASGKIGHMPINYVAEMSNITTKSAIRYNKILKNLKILYYRNRSGASNHGRQTNIYCMWSDTWLCSDAIPLIEKFENKQYGYKN